MYVNDPSYKYYDVPENSSCYMYEALDIYGVTVWALFCILHWYLRGITVKYQQLFLCEDDVTSLSHVLDLGMTFYCISGFFRGWKFSRFCSEIGCFIFT